jgi:hypothetical protein
MEDRDAGGALAGLAAGLAATESGLTPFLLARGSSRELKVLRM